MGKIYEVAVLGLGTMGSFTCLELARRKVSVVGVDPFDPPHERGSHTGDTRVFRIAYAEHPDYVPLGKRASYLWEQIGSETGATLLHRTGMLTMGLRGSALISGIERSAEIHGLPIEILSAAEIPERFPAFDPPPDDVGVFEREAGWVDVNASIRLALRRAEQLGAELRRNCTVVGWENDGKCFVVRTAQGSFSAQRLIVVAGAWAGRLLSDLKLPLAVQRKVLAWFDPLRPEYFAEGSFPVFAVAPNFLYGFPNTGGGVKLSIHWEEGMQLANPTAAVAPPTPEDWVPILEAAAKIMPGLAGRPPGDRSRFIRAKTCLYTMTPDEHFIIDRHPEFGNLHFAAGFSGHGFKFAPAIGEALADLALGEKTSSPVEFLRLRGRFMS